MVTTYFLNLSVTYFDGRTRQWLIPMGDEDCGYSRARQIIEASDEWLMARAALGHVESDGSVTPWLTELELLPEVVPL